MGKKIQVILCEKLHILAYVLHFSSDFGLKWIYFTNLIKKIKNITLQ